MIDRITFHEAFVEASVVTPSGLRMDVKLTMPMQDEILQVEYWKGVIEHLEKAAIERDRL